MKRAYRLFINPDQSKRDQFARTPEELLKDLQEIYGEFDFDPCPEDPGFNGLTSAWGENNFVNPPFNDLKRWLKKAIEEWNDGEKQVIFLMPVRLHTEYFLELVMPLLVTQKIQLYIIRKGVKFQGYAERAPFGVMYIHFPKSNKSSSEVHAPDQIQNMVEGKNI